MNRSSPASDNLFLRSYASLKGKSVRLTGTLVLLAVLPLMTVLAFSLGLGYVKLKQDMANQADGVGQELARQVAASVADPMAANDNLSLNIVLAQWNQNPLIAHAAVHTLDNRVVAEAGQRTARDRLAPGNGRFISAIHYQDTVTGQLHLSLAAEPFAGPARDLLRLLLISIIAIAVISGLVAWRLALRLRRVLMALGNWHGESEQPAPGVQRKDEIGDLARRLAQRRIVDMPEPEPAPPELEAAAAPVSDGSESPPVALSDVETAGHDESMRGVSDTSFPVAADSSEEQSDEAAQEGDLVEAPLMEPQRSDATEAKDAADEPREPLLHSLLAVRLGNLEALRRLPRPRLLALLERYRLQVRQASQIYGGELTVLDDGTSVLAFRADDEADAEELTRALSCGELLRVLGHDLQVGISDTGVNLFLQLAVSRTAEPELSSEPTETAKTEAARMLELLQFSRNLLLLDASLADQPPVRARAVIRKLASQPGSYCVERLNEPYQTLLERNLNQLYSQRPD